MRAAPTLTALSAALWLAANSAHAVGFGRISNLTQLGQTLNFTAGIRLDPDEVLTRECVSAEVQSGENRLGAGQVRVSLEDIPGANERRIRVATSTIIDEPVVTVTVTVGCTSSVTRKFVAFVDPPLINTAQTLPPESVVAPVAEPARPPRVVTSERVRPVPQGRNDRAYTARNRPRTPAAQAGGAVVAGRSPSDAVVAPPPPKQPRATTPSRQPSVARVNPPGPRLQLESAPVVPPSAAASAASAAAIAALGASQAASAAGAIVDDSAAQLQRERQRIQLLEDGLAKLRADALVTQNSLVTMQARLKQAESERYANPLVYALAWVSALLALAVGGLWWRLSRAGRAQWWTTPTADAAAAHVSAAAPLSAAPVLPVVKPLSAVQVTGSHPTVADAFEISTVIEDDEPPMPAAQSTRPAPVVALVAPAPADPPRELSVEELIDLEQQAEFFIVLGQDDAAIDLLMSHVRSDGGISPLPYLKLLEIYRRRGEEEAYQRIRERFNRRFNAYAPDWEADLQRGRSLPDYPDTIARLQALWSMPPRVMETLDASLFRRNNSDETFDLPAYRELLFLYSVARDLAEHGGSQPAPDVDLLLPLGGDDSSNVSRLTATRVMPRFDQSEMATMPLDLDVSFDAAPAERADEPVPSVHGALTESPKGDDSRYLDFELDPLVAPIKPKTDGH